jgi:hypothetical protein
LLLIYLLSKIYDFDEWLRAVALKDGVRYYR